MRTRHHNSLRRTPLLLVIFGALALLLAACRDPEITTYTAPKDPAPPPAAMPDTMPAGHPPVGASPATPSDSAAPDIAAAALTWTAPAAWIAKAPGQMVKASYTVPAAPGAPAADDASATISSFPGNVGGTFANINRWRGQIGLDPIAEKDLDATTTRIENGALHFTVVDIANDATGARMLAAILSLQNETYFFKMTGPTTTLAAQKQAFLDLLQTVKTK